MPTGLTYKIYEGEKTSLREFALMCAAQLSPGCVVTDRGDKRMPLDKAPVLTPVKPEEYKQKQLQRKTEELERLQRLKGDPDELRRQYDAERTKSEIEEIAYEKRRKDMRRRYDDMISRVEQWQVPEQYASLKKLMMEQLTDSRDFDCPERHPSYDYNPTVDEWIDSQIESCQRSIDYYREGIAKEAKWLEEANGYLQGLYRLLDETSPYEGECE